MRSNRTPRIYLQNAFLKLFIPPSLQHLSKELTPKLRIASLKLVFWIIKTQTGKEKSNQDIITTKNMERTEKLYSAPVPPFVRVFRDFSGLYIHLRLAKE